MGSPETINSSGLHVRLTIRISVLQWDGRKALCGFFSEPIYRSTAYDCLIELKKEKDFWKNPGFWKNLGFFLKPWFCGTNLGLSRKPWKFSRSGRSRYIYVIYAMYIWLCAIMIMGLLFESVFCFVSKDPSARWGAWAAARDDSNAVAWRSNAHGETWRWFGKSSGHGAQYNIDMDMGSFSYLRFEW